MRRFQVKDRLLNNTKITAQVGAKTLTKCLKYLVIKPGRRIYLTAKVGGKRRKAQPKKQSFARRMFEQYFPAWVLLAVLFFMFLPDLVVFGANALADTIEAVPGAIIDVGEVVVDGGADVIEGVGDGLRSMFSAKQAVAPLFTTQVAHWNDDIERWAGKYDLDPNMLATVMQIESCGHPTVNSPAGARGLFQVMPMHFADGEDFYDPDTNAQRSAEVLNDCLGWADGDSGLAMACYNGGPSVINADFDNWHSEPQNYYKWATGIYADARKNKDNSETLDQWLAAGGQNLCDLADSTLAGD